MGVARETGRQICYNMRPRGILQNIAASLDMRRRSALFFPYSTRACVIRVTYKIAIFKQDTPQFLCGHFEPNMSQIHQYTATEKYAVPTIESTPC